jgi:hypothetical protein
LARVLLGLNTYKKRSARADYEQDDDEKEHVPAQRPAPRAARWHRSVVYRGHALDTRAEALLRRA